MEIDIDRFRIAIRDALAGDDLLRKVANLPPEDRSLEVFNGFEELKETIAAEVAFEFGIKELKVWADEETGDTYQLLGTDHGPFLRIKGREGKLLRLARLTTEQVNGLLES